MSRHLYRAKAVEQAREAGWTGFRTMHDHEQLWKAYYEPGPSPADAYAATQPWCSHGELAWISATNGAEDPVLVGVLVCDCTYDELLGNVATVRIDAMLGRVWATVDGVEYLTEPLSGEKWELFTPKVGKGTQAGPGQTQAALPVAKEPRQAGAPVARSTADSPVKRVWAIADGMPGATRAQVVAACVEAGVNKSTAGTQYYHWSKARQGA